MQAVSKKRSYSRYGLGLTVFAAIGWIILGLDTISKWTGLPTQERSGDLLNWAALTVEIGLAVIITGVVFFVSKKQQDQIQEVVEKQQQFLNEQKEFQEKRRTFSLNMIRSYLSLIRHEVEEYDATKLDLKSDSIPDAKSLLDYYQNVIKQELKNVTFQLTFASDVLEPYHVERIRHILEITDRYIEQRPSHDAQHHGIIGNIDLLLKELPNPPA